MRIYWLLFAPIIILWMSITSVEAQTQQPYQYGYLLQNADQSYTLQLVNPANPNQVMAALIQPVPPNTQVINAKASPDGKWVAITAYQNTTSSSYIRVVNVTTGETREFAALSRIGKLDWSPDSHFLAFNAVDATLHSLLYSTYIYTLDINVMLPVKTGSISVVPSDFLWSPSSDKLVVFSRSCAQSPCQALLEVWAVPSIVLQASTLFKSFGDWLCDFAWSPDGRYVSFQFSCGNGLGLSYAAYATDVFNWDTFSGTIVQVTTFTPTFTSPLDINLSATYNSLYDFSWFDNQDILIGARVGRYNDNVGYDNASLQIGTYIYSPGGGLENVSADQMLEWTPNLSTGTVAFRNQTYAPYVTSDGVNTLQIQTASVQVATLTGSMLNPIGSFAAGCNLSWLPGGTFLAYENRGNPLQYCGDPLLGFNFVNETNGEFWQYLLPQNSSTIPLGWLQNLQIPPTPSITYTPTAVSSATPSNTATLTYTPIVTATPTLSDTLTPTVIPTATSTHTPTYTVTPTNTQASSETPTPLPTGSAGTGLHGEYYNNKDLTQLVLTRTDAVIAFDWGQGSPDPSIGSDTFSVRWTGQIEPRYSETYTFTTFSDDGVRLWINGQSIINNWTEHSSHQDYGTISLTAGQRYNIELDYYENTGGALIGLGWSSASQVLEIVPQSQLYESSVVVPTPTTAPQSTIVLQVAGTSNDVNEDGNDYREDYDTVWFGTGQSETDSYTGLRFTNVGLPPDATIVSAQLEFYMPENAWIGVELDIAGEAVDNSPTFSTNNKPSDRVLTINQVGHSSDSNWSAGNWHELEEITSVIQEIADRPGWESGNSISLILHGTGGSWGRKFAASFDGAPAFAPRLIITYATP